MCLLGLVLVETAPINPSLPLFNHFGSPAYVSHVNPTLICLRRLKKHSLTEQTWRIFCFAGSSPWTLESTAVEVKFPPAASRCGRLGGGAHRKRSKPGRPWGS